MNELVIDGATIKKAYHNLYYICHMLADIGVSFTDVVMLKLRDSDGTTVAHTMAARGHVYEDKEILTMADISGFTVAHEMAFNGHVFTEDDILGLTNSHGRTVKDFQDGYRYTNEMIKARETV